MRVLAVRRSDGTFLRAPGSDVVLAPGDPMIVYGHSESTRELAGRLGGSAGTEEHDRSKQRHDASQSEEARTDSGPRRHDD